MRVTVKHKEIYDRIFCEVFSVEKKLLNEEFNIMSVDGWDSITQLSLVTEMENHFDILLDTEHIMDFKSYEGGKTILKEYGIDFDQKLQQ